MRIGLDNARSRLGGFAPIATDCDVFATLCVGTPRIAGCRPVAE
jgi:hypothetical protein